MKKSAIGAKRFLGSNWRLLLLGVLFLAGILLGVSLSASDVAGGMAEKIAQSYLAQRVNQPFWLTIYYLFLSFFPFAVVAFVSGLCVAGWLVSYGLPLFKGLGYGLAVSYFYRVFGLMGIGYSSLLILPHSFLCGITLLLMCRESMRFSRLLGTNVTPQGTPKNLWADFKLYALRHGCFVVLALFSSILNAFLNWAFSGFFVFQ